MAKPNRLDERMPDWRSHATVSVSVAAQVLGVGRSAAYEAVRSGQLPAIRIGGRVLVPTRALADLLGIHEDLDWEGP